MIVESLVFGADKRLEKFWRNFFEFYRCAVFAKVFTYYLSIIADNQ